MALKRRDFLERAGWALAGLGFGAVGRDRHFERYGKALADTTSRKLALLVGINQYGAGYSLAGCLTDVELQRQLLIHRCGFVPADIVTLTDAQATEKNITGAFVSHLIEQARPGDVVVFHFSGFGRRLFAGGEVESRPVGNFLVPVDGVFSGNEPAVNDLSIEFLFLLLRSVSTDKVLAVFDTSYVYPGSGFQGSLRVRSLPQGPVANVSFEDKRLVELLKNTEQSGGLNKAILAAAGPSKVAVEMQGRGFSAGVFSYALTQTLWQATPARTLTFILNQAACTVEQLAAIDQQPQLENVDLNLAGNKVFDCSLGLVNDAASGVILGFDAESKMAQLWLGGLPARVLDSYGVNSVLEGVGESPALMLVRSRTGLIATAQVMPSAAEATIKKGDLVRELVRIVPRNVSLTVGLDSSLERIERVDATSAFAAVASVSPVAALEMPTDCLFGRLRETLIAQAPTAVLPSLAQTSYGLFSVSQNIIPNTVGESGEAVKSAVRRLAPHLHTLLAAKLWRLTANESGSRLGVRASLELVEGNQSRVLVERGTLEAGGGGLKAKGALVLPAGSRIQYRLHNESEKSIYYVIVGIDNRGRAFASAVYDAGAGEGGVVHPGESVSIPAASSGGPFLLRGVAGLAEAQLVCCREPLTRTVAELGPVISAKGDGQPVSVLASPLPVAQALLQDLHQASAESVKKTGVVTDGFALDMRVWATLSFVYRVV